MTIAASYSSIVAIGVDSFDFLQGQLSNDLRLLDTQEIAFSAWCNPKGRVICLLHVTRTDGGFLLTLPRELAASTVVKMSMFRFRAKVDFDVRAATLASIGASGDTDDWFLNRLRAGIPEVFKAQSEQFTPHMLNLDLLGAVSFDKGCYPGQEIVARTHYRGASKRRMLRFEASEPVLAGDAVVQGGRKIGDVVNAIGRDLLAVVPLASNASELAVGNASLAPKGLPYL